MRVIAAVPLLGTGINVAAIVAGTAAGTLLEHRFPERIRETVMAALGLATIVLGVDAALEALRPPLTTLTRASVVIVLGSVLAGGVVGELLRIEDRLTSFGEGLKRRFGDSEARFVEGFVVASLVFCVGPLAILGSLQDGLRGDVELLAVKSLLDGFAALAFASGLGVGVGFSVIPLVLYQGTVTLLARSVAGSLSDEVIAAVTAAGGILILGIGLRLLDVKQIRVGNLLPALVFAPIIVAIIVATR